mmetsp:Transcript_40304/g.67555  ORF Transcript_40304/g.67555 Transcript_40304/m.67555 type:complete len:1397 (+) Transcript_40304:190-4380(+)
MMAGACTVVLLFYGLFVCSCIAIAFTLPHHPRMPPWQHEEPALEIASLLIGAGFGFNALNDLCNLLLEHHSARKKVQISLALYVKVTVLTAALLEYCNWVPLLVVEHAERVNVLRALMWMFTTPVLLCMVWFCNDLTINTDLIKCAIANFGMILCGMISEMGVGAQSDGAIAIAGVCFIYVLYKSNQPFNWSRQMAPRTNVAVLVLMQATMLITWTVFPIQAVLFKNGFITSTQKEMHYLFVHNIATLALLSMLVHAFCINRQHSGDDSLKNFMNLLDSDTMLKAHELRTPLNAIIGLSAGMLGGSAGKLNPTADQLLELIKSSGNRLLRIVNDLLDTASKGSSNKELMKTRLSLRKVLTEGAQLISVTVHQDVQLKLVIADDLKDVYGDEQSIHEIMNNLLGNATKFTTKGYIEVSARNIDQDKVEVVVSDTGCGIPKHMHQAIYEPFVHATNSQDQTGKFGSTGLGLYTVKKLVNVNGWDIKLVSEETKGSTFTLTLHAFDGQLCVKQMVPRKSLETYMNQPSGGYKDQASLLDKSKDNVGWLAISGEATCTISSGFPYQQRNSGSWRKISMDGYDDDEQNFISAVVEGDKDVSKTSIVPQDGERKTYRELYGVSLILSVDDDAVNHLVLESFLKPSGVEMLRAMNGPEALEILENKPYFPDLILLDVMMPGMSGYEVCEILRERYSKLMPVIFVSAKCTEEDIVAGLKKGGNDYITKPLQQHELMARVDMQLKLKELYSVELEKNMLNNLLSKMLPTRIISQLKRGQNLIAEEHEETSILFSDIVGFTTLASNISTQEVVLLLNAMFTQFDNFVDKHDVMKVETIGDAYMAASGHMGNTDHANKLFSMGRDMITYSSTLLYNEKDAKIMGSDHLRIRVGIHCGPTIAGVVGTKCPRYCFFGDTVNTASRMESTGTPMCIHMSDAFYNSLDKTKLDDYEGEIMPRGKVKVKGKGEMATWMATVIPGTELLPVEELEPDPPPFIPEASGSHLRERRTSYQSLERSKGVVLTKEDLECLLATARTRRKSITDLAGVAEISEKVNTLSKTELAALFGDLTQEITQTVRNQISMELKAAPFSRDSRDSRDSVRGRSMRHSAHNEDCEENFCDASKTEYPVDREARYREATKGEHPEDRKMKQWRELYKGEAAAAEEERHFEEEMTKSRTTSQVKNWLKGHVDNMPSHHLRQNQEAVGISGPNVPQSMRLGGYDNSGDLFDDDYGEETNDDDDKSWAESSSSPRPEHHREFDKSDDTNATLISDVANYFDSYHGNHRMINNQRLDAAPARPYREEQLRSVSSRGFNRTDFQHNPQEAGAGQVELSGARRLEEFLATLNLSHYTNLMLDQGLDLELLETFDDSELLRTGVHAMGARILILKAFAERRHSYSRISRRTNSM